MNMLHYNEKKESEKVKSKRNDHGWGFVDVWDVEDDCCCCSNDGCTDAAKVRNIDSSDADIGLAPGKLA